MTNAWPVWSPTWIGGEASGLPHLLVPEIRVWASADPAKAANRTVRPSDLYFIVFPLRRPMQNREILTLSKEGN